MPPTPIFDERVAIQLGQMSGAMQRVALLFQDNRAEVLYQSAASLAARASTSDATVIRTVRALGFAGLDDLRRALAAEMKAGPSTAERLADTLKEIDGGLDAAFSATLDLHVRSINRLRDDVTPELFRAAVDLLSNAHRVAIFGIGPSDPMANYLALQLNRFGIESRTLTRTGLLFADDLAGLRAGDIVVIFAYTHVRREVSALLDHADRLGLKRMLVTDSLRAALRSRIDLILPAARGRADLFSMHTATLALIEALLVGVATSKTDATLEHLALLDSVREELAPERERETCHRSQFNVP